MGLFQEPILGLSAIIWMHLHAETKCHNNHSTHYFVEGKTRKFEICQIKNSLVVTHFCEMITCSCNSWKIYLKTKQNKQKQTKQIKTKSKQKTLEKVAKTFSDEYLLYRTLWPFFFFFISNLQNEEMCKVKSITYIVFFEIDLHFQNCPKILLFPLTL